MSKLYLLLFVTLFSSCTNFGQLKWEAEIPEKLSENSGIARYTDETVWLIEDNGNGDNIYQVDFKGKLRKEFEVKNAKNQDWEDLAKDELGNLYIGDFGNNDNARKDLVIYKLPNPETEPGDKIDAKRISFSYPEQTEFPPRRGALLYDAEAFFYYEKHLYIFTKNRANPFSGEASIYKVPAKIGRYEAELIGKIITCSDWNTCQITSADISPDHKTIVLLGYGKLWTLTGFSGDDFARGQLKEIDLGVRTQLESVCFKDNSTLLLSDEVRGGQGGNLYSYLLK